MLPFAIPDHSFPSPAMARPLSANAKKKKAGQGGAGPEASSRKRPAALAAAASKKSPKRAKRGGGASDLYEADDNDERDVFKSRRYDVRD
jgi:hypothetical protein